MKCKNCDSELKKVSVKVYGAKNKAISYQCPNCDHFEFDKDSSGKVLDELKNAPLKIKQKVVKISKDRLGMYINKDIARCLEIESGQEVYVSVPDKKHIIISLEQ